MYRYPDENSGLLSWLKSAFGEAEKMLTGKKFPMNIRALRLAQCLSYFEIMSEKLKVFNTLLTSWMLVHQKVCPQNTGLIIWLDPLCLS